MKEMVMTNNNEKWEEEYRKIKQQNEKILEDFVEWLEKTGLTKTTVKKHCFNVDFFINEFLLREDMVPAKDGVPGVDMFLGYWFIKTAMWANVAAIKQNATSIRKFYQFMMEKKEISSDKFEELKKNIRENMPEWLDRMRRYDDPDIMDMEEEEVWFF